MTGILNSMSQALNAKNTNPQSKPNSLNLGASNPTNGLGTSFRRATGNAPTSTPPQPTTVTQNQQTPSMTQSVSDNLNANSLLMNSAAAKGERMAANRGLQNSTLGIESAQRAMIDAAMPIAQVDVSNQHQLNMQRDQQNFAASQAGLDRTHQESMARLNSSLAHDNAMKELGAQVSANTIGKSIDFAMQITSNFDAQIAGILNNTQMSADNKKKAIDQLKASRDSEMEFMSAFMQKIPTTKQNWAAFPTLGVPTIAIR